MSYICEHQCFYRPLHPWTLKMYQVGVLNTWFNVITFERFSVWFLRVWHARIMCQTCAYRSHEFKSKTNITSQNYVLFLFTDCGHHSLTIKSFVRGAKSTFFLPRIPFYIYLLPQDLVEASDGKPLFYVPLFFFFLFHFFIYRTYFQRRETFAY